MRFKLLSTTAALVAATVLLSACGGLGSSKSTKTPHTRTGAPNSAKCKTIAWTAAPAKAHVGSAAISKLMSSVKASAGPVAPGITVAIGRGSQLAALGQAGVLKPHGRKADAVTTSFDLASITKTAAATVAAMALYEDGQLDLNAKAVKYWPELKSTDKDNITIRQLLTHTSGLQLKLNLGKTHDAAMNTILKLPLKHVGTYLYSNLNFVMLWEIEKRILGGPVEKFVAERVWSPLGMCHTGFHPTVPCPTCAKAVTSVTSGISSDQNAQSLGVTGCAGLFSTAPDQARLLAMMASRGKLFGKQIFLPSTVALFTKPQVGSQALGWDTEGEFAPKGTSSLDYGHTGWSGTSTWVDPKTGAWAVVLTNYQLGRENHPNHTGWINLRNVALRAASNLS